MIEKVGLCILYELEPKALEIVAHALQILFHKPQTLAHEDSHRASSIRRRPKQLNWGEAWGDQGKALELLLGAREA
jgi:hypothetical protein